MPSKTGSIALRLAEVQPPKTAATQSLLISFWAFSAKVVGSEAPSSAITSSCLPLTPPAALISSLAISSASYTVFSLIAMVPERELRKPILIVSPSVFTQLVLPVPPAVSVPTLLPPQALSASAEAAVRQMAEKRRRLYA